METATTGRPLRLHLRLLRHQLQGRHPLPQRHHQGHQPLPQPPHPGHHLQAEAAAMETVAVTAMETATAREDKLHELFLRLHGLFTYYFQSSLRATPPLQQSLIAHPNPYASSPYVCIIKLVVPTRRYFLCPARPCTQASPMRGLLREAAAWTRQLTCPTSTLISFHPILSLNTLCSENI